MVHRFVYPTGWSAKLTPEQYDSLTKVATRCNMTGTVEVSPLFGGDGALILNTGNMFLVVEPDGYTHS